MNNALEYCEWMPSMSLFIEPLSVNSIDLLQLGCLECRATSTWCILYLVLVDVNYSNCWNHMCPLCHVCVPFAHKDQQLTSRDCVKDLQLLGLSSIYAIGVKCINCVPFHINIDLLYIYP